MLPDCSASRAFDPGGIDCRQFCDARIDVRNIGDFMRGAVPPLPLGR